MAGYSALAQFYDAITGVEDQKKRGDYYFSLFKKYSAGLSALLDLACGSMESSMCFLRKGIDVIGVDVSPDMLALAADNTARQGFNPLLLCQDIRRLDLFGTVDGAMCAMDGLNHLKNAGDVQAALKKVALFLEPDGLFIFDVNTPYKHCHILADNAFVFEQDDFLCVWRNQTDKSYKTEMFLDFFVHDKDEAYTRLTDYVCEQAYDMNTWQRMLTAANLEIVDVFDDLSDKPPHGQSEKWIFVTRHKS